MITLPNAKGRTYGIIRDPYYSAVSLLLHMNGTNGSTTFTDSGPNALSVTAVGNAQISTTQSKYGGASAYFDGSGDYLSIPTTSAFGFGTSDYTAECWIYIAGGQGTDREIFDFRPSPSSAASLFISTANKLTLWNGITIGGTGTALNLNQWYHVALCRSAGVTRCYLNGVQEWSSSVGMDFTSSRALGIGSWPGNGLAGFFGYIDDLRISLFARYVSTFTPPTAALPTTASSTPADPYYGYTSLLLHMDGSSGSTNFVDSGPNALAVTPVGNTQISTTQSKYGGASAYFDGTGDYLSIANYGSLFTFGTGDFTVEAWVYVTSSGTNFSFLLTEGTNTDFAFYVDNTRLGMWDGASSSYYSSAGSVPLNQWVHVAFSRSGGFIRGFVNGVLTGSVSNSRNMTNSQAVRVVGSSTFPNNSTCYVDELRVTKGVARYTSNFTPPTKAYPNVYNPYASLPVNGAILWLDASKQSSLFTDAGSTNVKNNGDLVYQWNDLSGANNHATQSTSGSRPTWSPPASGQNGLGAVKILGATSNQSLSATVPASIWNNPFSLFFVFVNTATNSNKDVFIQGSVATGGYRSVWISNASPSKVAWSQFASVLNMANTANPQAYAISLSSDAQSTSAINAITNSTSYSGTVSHISISSNTLYLGGLGTPADYTLCEMAIFPSRLTSDQLTSLNNYAKTKWGTA